MIDDANVRSRPEIVALDRRAIDDMVGKVAHAAEQGHTETELAKWRADYGDKNVDEARTYAVVGETLMYLHTCGDGVVVPVAQYPDGSRKVYSDHEHVGELSTAG